MLHAGGRRILRPLCTPQRSRLCANARAPTHVSIALSTELCSVYCWTDSTIVLAWLRQSSTRWKTFVANRVSNIQSLVPNTICQHVATDDNPADCASRRVPPANIAQHPLWWSRPEWLSKPSTGWPLQESGSKTEFNLEARLVPAHHLTTPSESWELQTRFSSWSKPLRVTALLFRFI